MRVLLADRQVAVPHADVGARRRENLKSMWDRASVERRAFLPYEDWDAENSRVIAPPTRMQLSLDLRNHIVGSDRALSDIQAALGMYQANLGAPSNESSGIAIESRKQQGEASTANFPSQPRGLARPGRQAVHGDDVAPRRHEAPGAHPRPGLDARATSPSTPSRARRSRKRRAVSINPNVGKYDVRVVIGASFSRSASRRRRRSPR
jgi:hypothetical protein